MAIGPDQIQEAMNLAARAAKAPAHTILDAFVSGKMRKSIKADQSDVTDIDLAAEETIRAVLTAASPYDITGEELGAAGNSTDYRWLIDPIDGTKSFVRGIPTFGTIVALEDAATGQAIVGAIFLPYLNDLYVAGMSLGSWKNGARITVAPSSPLSGAIVSAPDSYQFKIADFEEGYRRLRAQCRHLRGYTDCWAHAMAASGAIDVVVEPHMNSWDIRATQVLVTEANGLCLTRSSVHPKAVDGIFGVRALVEEVAELVGF